MNRRHIVLSLASFAVAFFAVLYVSACESWESFRYDQARTAYQPYKDALSDPARISSLHVVWQFHPPGVAGFRASPIVPFNGMVYIGNGNGRLYAVDASTGVEKWHYPPMGPALTSQFTCNPSSLGIASSAAFTFIAMTPAVIFAAPDRTVGTGLGEGRLFALNANSGSEIWKSPVLANLTGLTGGSPTERHEQIGYSSPLIYNGHAYVGIGDHCDNPIQWGRIVAVNLSDGSIDSTFNFQNGPRPGSRYPPGGDVWGSVAESGGALYTTTGNQKELGQNEPSPSRGLSMLRLDPNTGSIIWQDQPVPYVLDVDPDWSTTPTVTHASCGDLAVSTQKDGWTWALQAGAGPATPQWVFPADNPNWIHGFTTTDGTNHDDTPYIRPGAAWGDVYVTMDGGEDVTSNVYAGFSRLHALNVCASDYDRVRWIADIPNVSFMVGPPTITNGMIFVGTDAGHLIALADPSIMPAPTPAPTYVCSKPSIPNALCGGYFRLVQDVQPLINITLDGPIATEPVIARHNIYVATDAGTLYMLDP